MLRSRPYNRVQPIVMPFKREQLARKVVADVDVLPSAPQHGDAFNHRDVEAVAA